MFYTTFGFKLFETIVTRIRHFTTVNAETWRLRESFLTYKGYIITWLWAFTSMDSHVSLPVTRLFFHQTKYGCVNVLTSMKIQKIPCMACHQCGFSCRCWDWLNVLRHTWHSYDFSIMDAEMLWQAWILRESFVAYITFVSPVLVSHVSLQYSRMIKYFLTYMTSISISPLWMWLF